MSRAMAKGAILALLACLLAGCGAAGGLRDAFLGRKSRLEPLDTATLGRTSRDEILRRFGAPDEIDGRRFDGLVSEVFFYYDEDFDEAGEFALPRAKLLACEFSRGVLTGYVFQVLDAEPPPVPDDQARAMLVKGITTRDQAESLLGHPQGRSLLPTSLTLLALGGRIGGVPVAFTDFPDGTREVWLYSAQSHDPDPRKIRQRSLIVMFDGRGIYLDHAGLEQWVSKMP